MWSWSHTNEAYATAEQNLQALEHDTLAEIWAEWLSDSGPEATNRFNQETYPLNHESALGLPDDVLAEAIWERAVEQAECSNGGYRAYMCPFQCGPHGVSFGD